MKDSPVKKLDFNVQDKENMPVASETMPQADTTLEKKSVTEAAPEVQVVKAAPTIKELEAEEPILQENPHRFVLFPIKYHEIVSCLHIGCATQCLRCPPIRLPDHV
jgi:ribonucleoside-diphosphate reductase subunit M2